MPSIIKLFITTLLLHLLVSPASADLPVHCLRHQVIGIWNVNITKIQTPKKGEVPSCGHKQPDDPNSSWIDGLDDFKTKKSFQIELYDNYTAKNSDGKIGNWTMIYDEGLEIYFDNNKYANFFYYYLGGDYGSWTSNCGKTAVGWYYGVDGKRACWIGEKVLNESANSTSLIGEQTKQLMIVQPKEYQKHATAMLQEQASARLTKVKKQSTPSFLGLQEAKGSDFDHHTVIVEKINKIPTKAWTAKVPSKFKSMSREQLNKFAGRRASKKDFSLEKTASSFIQESGTSITKFSKELDWSSLLGDLREQDHCGSCYIFSTIQMLEARLKKKFNETTKLSVQHALDCSFYNQGCRGGYPYLVEKFAHEFELVPESCSPYLGRDGDCKICDVSELKKLYKVESYR